MGNYEVSEDCWRYFGAELVGFETGMKTLRGTWYIQRMMNVDTGDLACTCGGGSY